jgi:hypothetical protein
MGSENGVRYLRLSGFRILSIVLYLKNKAFQKLDIFFPSVRDWRQLL